MAHGLNRLSVSNIDKARPGERLSDGGSLYLVVTPSGTKNWVFISAKGGQRREVGLGPLHSVPVEEARRLSAQLREAVAKGIDPIVERDRLRRANEPGLTFKEAAARFYEDRKAGWRSPVHAEQWLQSMRDYVEPVIGDKPISDLTVGDVLLVLRRDGFWTSKPVSASRVQSRMAQVIDWATAHGLRTGDNPAAWSRLKFILPSPKKLARVEHHPAVDYVNLPALMAVLAEQAGVSAKALRFLTLTGARTGEVTGAVWSEIDLEAAVWTVPGDRIKGGREHRVPLCEAAVAILRDLSRGSTHVFPGARWGSLSQMAMSKALEKALRDAGLPHASVHGMRATFRTFAADKTSTPREVVEMCLAHVVGSAAERAYQRSDHLDQRRVLMDRWGSYCSGSAGGTVVQMPLRGGAAA